MRAAHRREMPEHLEFVSRFAVRDGERIIFLTASQIDWIEGARDYVRLHTGGQAHLIRSTLRSVMAKLDPTLFVRIHRSSIVRVDAVIELTPLFHGDYTVTLHDGTQLRMSRRYRRKAREALGYGL